jgi:hypothetical protein
MMKRVQKRKAAPYRWHGCWELNKRDAIARCRWFIAYEPLTPIESYGIVAGYSGGGAFEFEIFFVRLKSGQIASCVIDDVDRVTGKPADMRTLAKRHHSRFNEDVDYDAIFEQFNYGWGYDVQYLVPEAIEIFELLAEDEEIPGEFDIVGGTATDSWVNVLLGDYFGITAAPDVLQRRMPRGEREDRRARAREWIPKLAKKAKKLLRLWEAS